MSDNDSPDPVVENDAPDPAGESDPADPVDGNDSPDPASEDESADPPGEDDSPGPGAALRAAREAMGTSTADIARSLRVPVRIVENIEDERFDVLPAPVFTRAYIRSYAELVELDPDTMSFAYDRKTDPGETVESEVRRPAAIAGKMAVLSRALKLPSWQSWVFSGTVILFVAAFGLFVWLMWPSDVPVPASSGQDEPSGEVPVAEETRPDPSEGDASVESVAPAGTLDETPADSAESEPAGRSGARISLPESPSAGSSEDLLDGPQDSTPYDSPEISLDGAGEESVPITNPLTYVPGDEHVLVFRFIDDCWVEVLDAGGALVHGDLELAGNELELSGQAPFTLTLGYASGVELEYNGQPVMLEPHTKDNVARLVLGL
ncbi:MAG: DUF4115 domain-containing protein [Gammaproteobacteria bacterium]|nr:DUF4115 domain-containing protein [Gammaproteobacteria bacterium]